MGNDAKKDLEFYQLKSRVESLARRVVELCYEKKTHAPEVLAELLQSYVGKTDIVTKMIDASEKKYKYFFNNLPIPGMVFDLDTYEILDVNDAAISVYGFSREEFLNMTAEKIRPPEEIPKFMKYAAMNADEVAKAPYHKHRKKNGEMFDVMVSAQDISIYNRRCRLVIITDMTERKKKETQLRSAVQGWQETFDSVSEVLFLLDRDMRITKCNSATENFLGRTESDILGHHCWEIVHGADCPDANCPINKMKISKKRESTELMVKERCLHVTVDPILDDEGNINGAVHIVADITERKQFEKNLQASEEKYRVLVESANSIILRMDPLGNVTYFNEYAANFLGYSKDEIVGKNIIDTIVPRIDSKGKDLTSMVLDMCANPEKYENNENENICKDGTRVWVAWTNKTILDKEGRCVEILCIGNDITSRKQAEEKLKESEEKFRLHYEDIPVMYFTVDGSGIVAAVNKYGANQLGYEPEELIGQTVLNVFHDDYKQAILEQADICLKNLGQVFSWQAKKVKKSGDEIWVEEYARALKMPNGETNIFVICNDISGEKATEKALTESQGLMERIFNFFPDAIIAIDNNGKVIAWNKAIEKMTGIPTSEMMGKGDFEYALPFYGERRPILVDMVLERKEDGSKYQNINWDGETLTGMAYMRILQSQDGEAYLYGTASPLKDGDGNIIGAIESIRDITAMKKTEVELQEKEEQFRLIFEKSGWGNLLIDENNKFIDCNQTAVDILKYPSKKLLVDQTPYDLSPEKQPDGRSSQEKTIELLQSAKTKGNIGFEWVHRSFEGDDVFVEVMLTAIKIKGKQFVHTSWQDITARKKSEEAIEKERDKFLQSTENSPYGISLINEKNQYVYVNPEFMNIFGYGLDDLSSRCVWFEKAYPDEEYRQQVISTWEEDLLDHDQKYKKTREFKVVCKNGQEKIIKFKLVNLKSGGYIIVYDDITEQKKAEEALIDSRNFLEAMYRAMPIGIVKIKTDREIAWISGSVVNMFGYEKDEIEGKKSAMLYQSENEYKRVGKALYTDAWCEAWMRKKDGTELICALRAS